MDAPIFPPPRRPVHADGSVRSLRRDAQHVLFQDLEHLRHAHEDRNPPGADLPHDVFRSETPGEHDHARKHRRDERRHRLPEHVAEWKEIQEPDRQKRPGVLLVLRHFPLDRDDVRENVAVCNDHALGFSRGPGCEDDFRGIFRLRLADFLTRLRRDRFSQLRQVPDGSGVAEAAPVNRVTGEHGACVDDGGNALEEVGRCAVVDRDEHDPFEQAPPQRDDPLGAVLSPDGDSLALDYSLRAQPLRKRARGRGHLGVCIGPAPIPVVVNNKFAGGGREIGVEVDERAPQHPVNYD